MRFLPVFAALVAYCAAHAVPLVPGDNSHYVEGESRYIWMPDGEGKPVLVDLQEPVDEGILRNRNGANNQYWLFTRQNPTTAQIIVQGDADSLLSSNYNANRLLMVIVHGWNNNGDTEMNPLITSSFLNIADANVIVVDWRDLANSNYVTAVSGAQSVGEFLGNFLVWVFNTAGGNWNNVHLVGFSLGAHVVGIAGRTAGRNIARITGLDPAGPSWTNNENALNGDDAQYVEAIHTDGGFLGIFNAIGNANFYPNGGRNPQPGCSLNTCSHGRSTELFAASVSFNHFVGRQCDTIAEAQLANCNGDTFNMGNGIVTKRGTGIYSLTTADSWPY